MSNDIYEKVSKCATCATYKMKNQKEPMIAHHIPDRPWRQLGTDLCEHKGKNYLVVVDYYSKFIETALLPNKTAGTVITHLKSSSQGTEFQRSWYPTTCLSIAKSSTNSPKNGDSNKQHQAQPMPNQTA